MPTNAELSKEVEDLRAKLNQSDENVKKLLALKSDKLTPVDDSPKYVVRDDNPGEGGGWVIKTPEQSRFDKKTGKTKQVFYNGTTANVQFVNSYGFVYTSRKDADLTVHRLENDFGYKVTPLDKDTMAEFRSQFDNMQPEAVETGMEKLSQPQVFGA